MLLESIPQMRHLSIRQQKDAMSIRICVDFPKDLRTSLGERGSLSGGKKAACVHCKKLCKITVNLNSDVVYLAVDTKTENVIPNQSFEKNNERQDLHHHAHNRVSSAKLADQIYLSWMMVRLIEVAINDM